MNFQVNYGMCLCVFVYTSVSVCERLFLSCYPNIVVAVVVYVVVWVLE